MCQELGVKIDLEKNVKELDLGENMEEIDAMDWMLTHQLSSKNLSVGEKLAMTDEFKKEVALENEKKRKETEGRPSKNCTPIGVQNSHENTEVRNRSETWTDSQIAQKAGVGTGTVTRYNRVMNSDDDNIN